MAIIKKKEFIKRLSRRLGITMRDLDVVLNGVIDEMEQIVKDGDTLKFKRFGMLSSTNLPERNGYSVKEKKTVQLTGGRRVTFRLAENIRFPGLTRGKHLDGYDSDDDDEIGENEPLTE